MENKQSIHDKAIRLVEGGIVEVDGLCVRMMHGNNIFDPCFECKMDSLCCRGDEMSSVCEECDSITREDCFLVLVKPNDKGLC